MTETGATPIKWHRSSRCSTGGCVEVAMTPDTALVRDSKLDDDSPVLAFSQEQWDDLRQRMFEGDLDFGTD